MRKVTHINKNIKTFDTFDQFSSAMRCGDIKPNTPVQVWDSPFEGDYRDAGWLIGIAEFYGGQPSIKVHSTTKMRNKY